MINLKKIAAVVASVMVMTSIAACTSKTANETTAASDTVATVGTTEPVYTTAGIAYSTMSIDTVYGSQLPQYLNHQYTFNGQPVDINVSNYIFIETFGDLCNMATYNGYPMTNEGFIDLSANMYEDNSEIPEGEPTVWGDAFVVFAESQLESTLIFSSRAQQNNLQLTEEQEAEIDSIFENLQVQAEENGLTLDEFFKIYFGDTATEESMREVISMDYMQYQYMQFYADNYEFNEEDIVVPNIRYVLYWAPSDGSVTEEEMAAQQALAQEVFDASTDAGLLQVEGALSYANGEAYEYGDEFPVELGVTVPEFEAWAYDEARFEGEVGLIQSERFGFFVVGYLGMTEISQDSKDKIAMAALKEEVADIIENGTNNLSTTQAYEPAQPVSASQDSMNAVQDAINGQINQTAATGDAAAPQTSEGLPMWAILLIAAGATGILGAIFAVVAKNSGKKNKKTEPKTAETKEDEEVEDIVDDIEE